MEYSLDGQHLASGSEDGSIRIWRIESCHATSSQTHRERPTRTPQHADRILLCRGSVVMALSFSRIDSNILASGEHNGEIKVWNVKEQACIHTFDSGDSIRSLFLAGGDDIACLALTRAMSVIRLWKAAEGSSDFASDTIGEADLETRLSPHGAEFSPSGSFLATWSYSRTGNESTVALYELDKTMTMTHSVVIPGCIAACVAVSPDSKELVIGDHKGRIRLFQTDDFSIQRDMDTTGAATAQAVRSAAFDPTCRFLAVGCQDGRVELRSL
jgi:WD40 repeat protein